MVFFGKRVDLFFRMHSRLEQDILSSCPNFDVRGLVSIEGPKGKSDGRSRQPPDHYNTALRPVRGAPRPEKLIAIGSYSFFRIRQGLDRGARNCSHLDH